MIKYKNVKIKDLDIFYREAGSRENPTILLLHGFPTSSHMFRNLMMKLESSYHLIAPDYPGFGQSSMPLVNEFDYSFDNLATVIAEFIDVIGLKDYSLYLMDYGAPVGFRIATKYPNRLQSCFNDTEAISVYPANARICKDIITAMFFISSHSV